MKFSKIDRKIDLNQYQYPQKERFYTLYYSD